MANLNFYDLARLHPSQVAPELLPGSLSATGIDKGLDIIDWSAEFDPSCRLEAISAIGANCVIGANTVLKEGVVLGSSVTIHGETVLEKGVTISDRFTIDRQSYFAEGASVFPMKRNPTHNYPRRTHGDVTIGPGVVLPSEVQLGEGAIVPTTDSIAQTGPIGTYRRMVTIFGGSEQPRCSVGCQQGITIDTLKERVANLVDTKPESAADYQRNMPRIEALGIQVQAAYNRERQLIQELNRLRVEAFAQIPDY